MSPIDGIKVSSLHAQTKSVYASLVSCIASAREVHTNQMEGASRR